MVLQPLVCSCRGLCATRSHDSPARKGLPLITIDCAGATLRGCNGEAYLILYPVVRMPRKVAGNIFVVLQILCDYHALRNRPAMTGMKFRKHTGADGDTADYPNREEKPSDTTQKPSTPPNSASAGQENRCRLPAVMSGYSENRRR